MVLADTSVWVDHFRKTNYHLVELLEQTQIVIHPWIIGELACGNLRNRQQILGLLQALPSCTVAIDSEVYQLIDSKKLMGKGIGWTDVNLIASCLLSDVALWTVDKRLHKIALSLRLSKTH